MANLREAGAVGKQLNAAETTVFDTKTWFLFVVGYSHSTTAVPLTAVVLSVEVRGIQIEV